MLLLAKAKKDFYQKSHDKLEPSKRRRNVGANSMYSTPASANQGPKGIFVAPGCHSGGSPSSSSVKSSGMGWMNKV